MPKFAVEFGKDGLPPAAGDGRLDAPAFHRNVEPIWTVIEPILKNESGSVVEIGSGTGQHVVTYAARAPHLTWWPNDITASHRTSIDAYRDATGLLNVKPAHAIDLMRDEWHWHADDKGRLAALLCFNVLHIAPWTVAQNLFKAAGRNLSQGGHLITYGPYKRGGAHTSASNEAFDVSLRQRDPEWGVRDMEAVIELAQTNGLVFVEATEMPANNFVLHFSAP